MSVFNIESNVWVGFSGGAITALDGESGTQLANVAGRIVQASFKTQTMVKRHSVSPDSVVAVNVGLSLPRVSMALRDCSDTTRQILFEALTSDGSDLRTSGGSTTVGKLTTTIQMWVESITGAPDLQMFAPALAVSPEQVDLVHSWARDASLYDGQILELIATRGVSQTTPAMMIASNTDLAGVYFA